ncbi:MAG: hypothetical protein C0402_06345 [Thermodesulfovibrio sp.]|nr:hypothetical protein [Thermodesulfovibrio sp.]
MAASEYWRQLVYYFLKLPLFSLRASTGSFQKLEDVAKICPDGPKTVMYFKEVRKACETYPFLKGQDAGKLATAYNLICAFRESDTYIYPFLGRKTVRYFNAFDGLEALSANYDKGPVLVLYSHTGSFYEVITATAELGYRVRPIAHGVDPATIETPFRWIFNMNMGLSERHFKGGKYLYTNTPEFARRLRKSISSSEKVIIYAALDLPRSFITEKRMEVGFLNRRAAFPNRIVEMFMQRGLPIMTASPYIDIRDGKLKRLVEYRDMPSLLSAEDILQVYALRLEEFITARPEQLLTLISLGGFFE